MWNIKSKKLVSTKHEKTLGYVKDIIEVLNGPRLLFSVLFLIGQKKRLIQLKSVVSALDFENPKPAITIMLPDED